MLDSALIVALYENKYFEEAAKMSNEFQVRTMSGRYPAMNRAKSHVMLGTVLWAAGDQMRALEQFNTGGQVQVPGVRTRWMVWSRVRAGHLLDALDRRVEALAAYKAAYDEKDTWGYRALIKPCLKSPCTGKKYPGHFSPY